MWVPSVYVFELIFRGIVVYLVLFALKGRLGMFTATASGQCR